MEGCRGVGVGMDEWTKGEHLGCWWWYTPIGCKIGGSKPGEEIESRAQGMGPMVGLGMDYGEKIISGLSKRVDGCEECTSNDGTYIDMRNMFH